MYAESIQGIIIAQLLLQHSYSEIAYSAAYYTDDDGSQTDDNSPAADVDIGSSLKLRHQPAG